MTYLHTALEGARVELAADIHALTPHRVVKSQAKRFVEWAREVEQKEQSAMPGPARSFGIGEPVVQPNSWIGGSSAMECYHYQITFAYPRDAKWASVAADDMRQIIAWFLRHVASTKSGVNYRRPILEPVQWTVIQDPEQEWDFYTLTLEVCAEFAA